MRRNIRIAPSAALLLVLASSAMAHPGHSGFGDLASGVIHPLTGVDHLLAMLACGALGAAMAGRAIWQIPALFAVAMLVGGILGLQGAWTAHAEYALLLSVPAVCLLLKARQRAGRAIIAIVTASVGLLHGAAHGAELRPARIRSPIS